MLGSLEDIQTIQPVTNVEIKQEVFDDGTDNQPWSWNQREQTGGSRLVTTSSSRPPARPTFPFSSVQGQPVLLALVPGSNVGAVRKGLKESKDSIKKKYQKAIQDRRIARAANFTRREEIILLRAVQRRVAVVENKKTDAATNSLKIEEWQNIEQEFNTATVNAHRDAGTLRRKYENIKRCVKRSYNSHEDKTNSNDEHGHLVQAINAYVHEIQNSNDLSYCSVTDFANASANVEDKSSAEPVKNEIFEPIAEVETEFRSSEATESFSNPAPVMPSQTVNNDYLSDVHTTDNTMNKSQLSEPFGEVPAPAKPFHRRIRNRKSDRPLDKMTAWVQSKADSAVEEKLFKRELHDQKKRHAEEEHELKKQILQLQLRHAEEQQAWLRKEHLEKMNRIRAGV